MKSSKSSFTFKSFEDLKALLKNQPISFPKPHQTALPVPTDKRSPELEEDLFKKAMEGVRLISRDKCVERIFQMELPGLLTAYLEN